MLYKNIVRVLKFPYRFSQLRSLLPLGFQSSRYRADIIAVLGKNCFDFALKIKTLQENHPLLLNRENLYLFLQSGKNYGVVIDAFCRLNEHNALLSHRANLDKLVQLGSSALDYVTAILAKENLNKTLFITQSEKKNLKPIGSVYTQAAFTHNLFRSISERDVTLDINTKQWVSKSCQKIRRHSLQRSWRSFLADFKNKTEFALNDKSQLKSQCYQTLGEICAPDFQQEVTNLSELIDAVRWQSQKSTYHPLLDSYQQVLPATAGLIEQLMTLFPVGAKSPAHDIFLQDLEQLVVLPENWASLLDSTARAELEIVAQELRRALCPADLLGMNPYPKYRLSINSPEKQAISLSADLPHAYISSELLTLQSQIVLQGAELNFYYQYNNGSYARQPYPLKNIPGLGTACLFAKFLGDNDPKLGNIAVSVLNPSSASYVMVALDSDHCFQRKHEEKPLFSNIDEIVLNPYTKESYYYNYFFLKYGGSKAESGLFSTLPDGSDILKKIASLPQTKRENFATAFNLAFFPPQAYSMFVEQYLTRSNPFNHRAEAHIKSHLLAEQEALYQAFEENDFLLNESFNSSDLRDNIFYRISKLAQQIQAFTFYEEHGIKNTPLFDQNKYLIEDYFIAFCQKKVRIDSAFQENLQKAFQAYACSLPLHEQESHEYVAEHLGLLPAGRASSVLSQESSSKTELLSFTPVPFQSDDTEELFATPILLTRQRRVSDIKAPSFDMNI